MISGKIQGVILLPVILVSLLLGGCAGGAEQDTTGEGERLRVVATTSIVGDVVKQVGGEQIDLLVLMGAGQDPHSYQPSARDLAAVEGADLIFINGFDFEEGLLDALQSAGGEAPIVAVSEEVTPILNEEAHEEEAHEEETHEEEAHEHGGEADPHVWFDVSNVKLWVERIEGQLSEQDPAHAERYAANARRYLQELDELDAEIRAAIERIPAANRKLVTNHDTFSYFARAYGFDVIGTVIPSFTTGVEPSAASLSTLIEAIRETGVPAVFVESTVNEPLAEVVAEETGAQVYQLYTDALGEEGSAADSYIELMRTNMETLVEALAGGTQ